MAQDSYGTKNQPHFAETGAPQIGTDLTLVSDFAAAVGNRRVGTTAQRTALTGADVYDGLEFYDTDLDVVYVNRTGSWIGQAGGIIANPSTASNATSQTITSSAGVWANLPTSVTTNITLTAPAWCLVTLGCWLGASANEIRAGVNITGATTSLPNDPEWGNTLNANAGTMTGTATKILQFAAGTTTATVQCYRPNVTGSHTCSYAVLSIIPLYFN